VPPLLEGDHAIVAELVAVLGQLSKATAQLNHAAVSCFSDLLNCDPTCFARLSEKGMVKAFLVAALSRDRRLDSLDCFFSGFEYVWKWKWKWKWW
jgi:hypothetical protein